MERPAHRSRGKAQKHGLCHGPAVPLSGPEKLLLPRTVPDSAWPGQGLTVSWGPQGPMGPSGGPSVRRGSAVGTHTRDVHVLSKRSR